MIDYNTYASTYDNRYKSDMCERENAAVKELLERYGVKDKVVLDVGCGTGFSLDICDIKRYKGIDISKEMIAQARKKHPDKKFTLGKVTSSKWKPEIIDCVLCLFSIPYIQTEAVNAIYRVLKKGGICVCVYYNKPYLNPDSVYGNDKETFDKDVDPIVKVVIGRFRSKFEEIENHSLTPDETYTVGVFRKEA